MLGGGGWLGETRKVFSRGQIFTPLSKCLAAREILPTFIVRHEEQAENTFFSRPLLVKELRT